MQVETKKMLGVPCPTCSKQIKMYRPAVPGRYTIHCKACGNDCLIDIPEELTEKVDQQQESETQGKPASKPNLLVVTCPNCKVRIKMGIPAKAGSYKLHCKSCDKDFVVNVPEKLTERSVSDNPQLNSTQPKSSDTAEKKEEPVVHKPTRKLADKGNGVAVLVRKRFLLSDKVYTLRDGANTIGMKDEHLSSDIMIDDKTISRRSVTLTSESLDNGNYRYLFTLNRTTNPVRLDGKEVAEGTSLYIEPGSVIELGRTKLILKLKS